MRTVKDIKSEMSSFDGDKRSAGYKELKEELTMVEASESSSSSPSKGLGDITKDVIASVGLDKLVEPDCADCEKRRKSMNEWGEKVKNNIKRFFYNREFTEMSDKDYEFLVEFFADGKPKVVSAPEQKRINEIYKNISGISRNISKCPPCVVRTVNALHEIYTQYSKQ
tara:strand:+ start:3402 stop:3905 length:504 start_codon:yes stop_codon:yes gene_type:complete